MPPADPNPRQAAGVDATIQPGSAVDVRSRFDGTWSGGFAVAEVVGHPGGPSEPRYRLRRQSDGAVLPRLFSHQDVVPTAINRRGWKQFPRS